MSEDNDIFINLATPDQQSSGSSKSLNKLSGGRWKDRRKLRMLMDERPKTSKRGANDAGVDGSHNRNEKRAKRQETPDHQGNSNKPTAKQIDKSLAQNKKANIPNVDDQIVSSLFTSNREITTSENTNKHDKDTEVVASNAPLATNTFSDLGIQEPLLTHLSSKMVIEKPTSIQKLVIPHLSSLKNDNDLFIHAQTGSGKTLAYLLPILSTILNMKTHVDRKSGAFALIIAPTRELASQIYDVATNLTNCCRYLVPCLLIGGERKKSEKARLRKGCNFIIGTPGRILDHLQNTQSIKEQMGSSLRYVILDEGDKLMELGFEETLRNIFEIVHNIPIDTKTFPKLPSRIIHVLCSATLKENVKQLGSVTLKNYKLISNSQKKGETNEDSVVTAVPDQLLQNITIVPPKLRLVTLAAILNNITIRHTKDADGTYRTMVFLSCADSVDFHFEAFSSADSFHRDIVEGAVRLLTNGCTTLPCFKEDEEPNVILYKLHGSLSQQTRSATLRHFASKKEDTKGKHLILFCTDVASRGLDLPQVGTVIELDPPFNVEDHLHRIGRTARAGRAGESILFLMPGEEEGYMDVIKPFHKMGWTLLKFDKDILMPAFSNTNVGRSDMKERKKKDIDLEWDTNATTWHLNVERRILEDSDFKEVASKGYSSHIRAYTTHIAAEKAIFNVKFIHLGHLAKSFGLRERPKTMGIQTSKQQKEIGESKKSKEGNKNKMWRIARMTAKDTANEFNY